MLNIIIGKNAVEKTVMLRKMICQVKHSDVASNLSKYQDCSNMTMAYNTDVIDFISKELGDIVIPQNETQLIVDGFDYGRNFLMFLTVLSRNVTNFYLDEPEYGLQNHEVNMMAHLLVKLSWELPNIWVTTNEELLLDIHSKEVSYYIMEKDNSGELFLRKLKHY